MSPTKEQLEEAFQRGLALSHITGEATLDIINPYDPDDEEQLFDAWDEGFNWDSDIKGEIAHFGV